MIAGTGRSEKFWTLSLTTCDASSPKPSEAVTSNVPLALTIEKLEFPIFVKVNPDTVPIAEKTPSLTASLSVFEDVKLYVVLSIVIEYCVEWTPCKIE